ncbi:hypothetical protein HYY74_02775 [Candidatus Woesearchaeota archaeon]|nr:hypothetical protein [Candidatus Woesearchaeota archaeon]
MKGNRYYLILGLFMAALITGCGKADSAYSLPDLIENSDRLLGQEMRVSAMVINTTSCSNEPCPASNPCCQTCTAQLFLAEEAKGSIRLPTNLQCTGTNCQTDCQLSPGKVYLLKGRLQTDNLGRLYFNTDSGGEG